MYCLMQTNLVNRPYYVILRNSFLRNCSFGPASAAPCYFSLFFCIPAQKLSNFTNQRLLFSRFYGEYIIGLHTFTTQRMQKLRLERKLSGEFGKSLRSVLLNCLGKFRCVTSIFRSVGFKSVIMQYETHFVHYTSV